MRTRLIIFTLIFLCSCSSRRSDDSSTLNSVLVIDLQSEPAGTLEKLSEFAAEIEYIPLQTSESSLMGRFSLKVVKAYNKFFILNSGEILCFDINGNFLSKFNKIGRGPEEYSNIADFDISSDNKVLTILSTLNHRLIEYTISDNGFSFQRSITLKSPTPYLVSLVPETTNAFLAIPPWTGTEPTLSLMINAFGDTVYLKPNCYKYLNVRNSNFQALNEMLVYSFQNMVCFKEKFSDTVFYADAKENIFKPRMILNSNKTLITPAMRGGSEKVGDNTTFVPYMFETSRYIFYWYFRGNPLNGILFDKTTQTKLKLNIKNDIEITLPDDLSGGPDFSIEYINKSYCSGGNLFSFIEAIKLKNYVSSKDFENSLAKDPKKKEALKKLADSLKETDNPVLIVVTPKE